MKKFRALKYVLHLFVLLLFVGASSGFTAILHECSIPQKADCCAAPDKMPAECCQLPAPNRNGPTLRSDQLCLMNIVVDGLQVPPAVSEQQTRILPAKDLFISASQADAGKYDSSPSQSFVIRSLSTQILSKASRDRSVLFSSLLI